MTERRKSPREPGDWVHPKSEPQAAHSQTRRPRWLLLLSCAAAVVLAAGLAWRMHGLAPDQPKPAAASVETTLSTAAAAPHDAAPAKSSPYAPDAAPRTVAPAPAGQSVVVGHVAPNLPGDTPAQQLDRIAQLFAQGHDNLGRKRLAAFVQAHPQWDLPPELCEKLRRP